MSADDDSRLAGNILLFCRTLRAAGVPIGPAQVLEALQAVVAVGVHRRDDLRCALRAVLINDPSQFRLFEQAFHIYFRNPRLLERMIALLLPSIERPDSHSGSAMRRLAEALSVPGERRPETDTQIEVDRSNTYSARELLRQKDFEDLSLAEQQEARELLLADIRLFAEIATRRFRAHPYGRRIDLRRSMQLMIRHDGQLLELARKRRRRRPPVLVLLCDISGSMSHYSRMFLQFAHALSSRAQNVHTFVFGTRLTNVTRRLRNRDVDTALARVADDVVDWDGGTRIAACLERFNREWARRVLAQNAIVVLLSDGLERDTQSDLDFQMRRLHHSCRSLIWLNPMLRYDGFEVRAFGIRTMLPHVDHFLPAHSVGSLSSLVELLSHYRDGTTQVSRAA